MSLINQRVSRWAKLSPEPLRLPWPPSVSAHSLRSASPTLKPELKDPDPSPCTEPQLMHQEPEEEAQEGMRMPEGGFAATGISCTRQCDSCVRGFRQ